MNIVDADAHVLEIDRTWEYMDSSEQGHRPEVSWEEDARGLRRKYWIIDGHRLNAPYPEGGEAAMLGPHSDNVEVSDDAKFLLDVGARVRHMDELGTAVQVLYPTVFINPLTERPEVELALCRSYNRYMADVWAEGKGRLRWAAVIPYMTIEKALEEMRWVRRHGACAVMIRGIEAHNRLVNDPYFDPVYREAIDLDIPVCIHAANGSFDMSRAFSTGDTTFAKFKFPGLEAFHLLLLTGLPDQYPGLRFGFVEFSSQWLPYVIHDLERRIERRGRKMKERPLADNRIWVASQTNDDFETIMRYVGDDNLVMGTDYGHADTSTEVNALREFMNDEKVNSTSVRKILHDNAVALYGLGDLVG